MIVKDLDPAAEGDARAKAGRAAEEQMAHYLRRAFADDPDVLVLNGLRLEAEGDSAQIDHLIIHPFGLIIIESKSVTTKLRVSAQGEWSRWYGGRAHGMPSPVLQAERQRDFLRAYLRRDPVVLGGKEPAINVRVAISDSGMIDRPRRAEHDELDVVFKADQIPQEVRETVELRKMASRTPIMLMRLIGGQMGVNKGDPLASTDIARVRAYLLAHHRSAPTRHAQAIPVPAITQQPLAAHSTPTTLVARCPSCGGTDLSLERGYSDYFRCRSCGRNMASATRCPSCGAKEVVRRTGAGAFLDCKGCGASRTFPGQPRAR